MATADNKPERKVSVNISVRVGSVTAEKAQEIEDKIRDLADDYEGVDVMVTRSAERPTR